MTSLIRNWFYQNGDIITVLKRAKIGGWQLVGGGGGGGLYLHLATTEAVCFAVCLIQHFFLKGIKVETEK